MKKLQHAFFAATMIVGAAALPALADTPAAGSKKTHHGIGLMLSNIAGSGLTYQQRFDNGWGYHISGIGWGQGGSAFYNFGGAITKDIVEHDWGSVYGLAAVGYGVDLFAGLRGAGAGANIQSNFAPGVGLRYHMLTMELGYSVYSNASGPGFGPAGGAGVMFNF